ncbi:MAG: hypothetical protein A3C35_06570 [Omnitrophica bacterium RIFCSPHIGHO2_02_FULL_46_11]|nr:MAG: hypothetical protein A3A81_05300 [Omnitrophica bacterium RIFCSPLOWO2_01_FULL_45_10b]OGW87727.1 MAG: hypothetical protein A3C35_06570 [Omnitrophica bacterium RIFCSPHIGHO2_02_FULL_46_11]
MSSPEILDQRLLEQLCRQIDRKKYATTYLFTEGESEKKKALAAAFAKALNCTALTFQIHCDCTACRRIDSGNYPDVKWYGMDEEANSIKIEEVRDFQNWLNLKPFESKVKVFIFNGAERLTADSQHALLKSLEEPPPGNVIILLVPHAKSIFDTIASRSVEIKIPSFASKAIRDILIHEGAGREEAEFLARWSQGSLSRSREGRSQKWFNKKNEWLDQLEKDPVSFLENFSSASRDEIARVFDFLIEWVRDILVCQAAGNSEGLIHMDRFKLLESLSSRKDFESAQELFEALSEIRKSLDDYANQKLALTQAEILWERFSK